MQPTLPRRPLGTTGLEVSVLGLGTVKFGRNQSVKYPGGGFDLPTDEAARGLIDQAKAAGINLIDTAPAYGISEERLGFLLYDRADWILCTKVGEEFEDGGSQYDFSADHTKRSLHRSLRRLKTDRLDVVLIHSDGSDLDVLSQEVLPTLLEWREMGIVRAVGISSKTVAGGRTAIERGCDVVMMTYNPWHRDEEPVIETAEAAGAGLLIKKAFGSGHFGTGEGETVPTDPVLESLSLCYSHAAVSCVVTGTLNPRHLAENCAAAQVVSHRQTRKPT